MRKRSLDFGEGETVGVTSLLLASLGLMSLSRFRRITEAQHEKIQRLEASDRSTQLKLQDATILASEKTLELEYAHEKTALIAGKVVLLEQEAEYLKGQIELYQTRLGLRVPTPSQQGEKVEHKPIRKSREPFDQLSARIGKAQADKMEEYWRARIAAHEVSGVTSENTEETKDKDDTASS